MSNNQNGFSLIELLLVVTIVGIISAISVTHLFKAVGRAENGNAFASMKTIAKAQVSFFARNGRYGRLPEINSSENDSLGTVQGNELIRGPFTLSMSPPNPTNADLSNDYEIIATKGVTQSGTPCVIAIGPSGEITEIINNNCIDFR